MSSFWNKFMQQVYLSPEKTSAYMKIKLTELRRMIREALIASLEKPAGSREFAQIALDKHYGSPEEAASFVSGPRDLEAVVLNTYNEDLLYDTLRVMMTSNKVDKTLKDYISKALEAHATLLKPASGTGNRRADELMYDELIQKTIAGLYDTGEAREDALKYFGSIVRGEHFRKYDPISNYIAGREGN